MSDSLIAYGARCTWWDAKSQVGVHPSGLPCCPHCKGVLFETSEADWWAGAVKYAETENNRDYVKFLEWSRGRCYQNIDAALAAYAEAMKATS